MPSAQEAIFIPSPTVEAFDATQIRSCRACNIRLTWWDRLMAILRGSHPGVANVRFCSGGKAPTENRGMLNAMMTGELEAFNPCAGITESHLHVSCKQCGFSYLMHTRTPNAKAS